MNTFSDFFLAEALMRGLANEGYTTPTPVQAQVIPLAMDGLDLLVSAATGSGKTAAFLLPIMQRFIGLPHHERQHPCPDPGADPRAGASDS
ncbi:MAG: DEAD/DEAH box helicase [Thermochromatium sp.]